MRLNELCHILTRALHSPECACSPVLPYTLLLVGDVLVESAQQRLVFASKALIRVTHHLSRHESLTIGQVLIVLDDLRLDVIQFAVNLQSLFAAAFGTVTFHVPHIKWNRLLTTELALRAVNRYPAHHGHHTVLLLTLVHIEQNVKSTSHVSYSFFNFGCKTTFFLGIHRHAKCSSLRNKNGLRFGNLTPSPILPNLLLVPI